MKINAQLVCDAIALSYSLTLLGLCIYGRVKRRRQTSSEQDAK